MTPTTNQTSSTGPATQTENPAAASPQSATAHAKEVASEGIATLADQFSGMIGRQINSAADMVGHVAHSAESAASDLDETVPQLAGLMRGVASHIEGYSDGLRDKSVADLYHGASDFARKQPALVFGVAMILGFLAVRTIKAASTGNGAAPQSDA